MDNDRIDELELTERCAWLEIQRDKLRETLKAVRGSRSDEEARRKVDEALEQTASYSPFQYRS